MIDTLAQYRGSGVYVAMHESDADLADSEYKRNQPVRLRVTTATPTYAASKEQDGLVHACFKLVSDSSDNANHRTPSLVKMACKICIDFRDTSTVMLRPDGQVQLFYRSFAHDKLKGRERNEWIQRAIEWCADTIGLTVDELVAEAKSRMGKEKWSTR